MFTCSQKCSLYNTTRRILASFINTLTDPPVPRVGESAREGDSIKECIERRGQQPSFSFMVPQIDVALAAARGVSHGPLH